MVNWKQLAEEAMAEGFLPGRTKHLLDDYLQKNKPELVKELGADYQDYLTVRAVRALKMQETLEDQGTEPETARELAQAELLE